MRESIKKKKFSAQQRKYLKKIYAFSEEDKQDAIQAVRRISQRATNNALNNSSRFTLVDFDDCDSLSHSQPSYSIHERGVNGKENVSIGSKEKRTTSQESPLRLFTGIRKRRKNKNSAESSQASVPAGAWMCGVTGKRFHSYEEACRYEDNQIRQVLEDLGWARTSLDDKYNYGAKDSKSRSQIEQGLIVNEVKSYQQEKNEHFVSLNDIAPSSPPRKNMMTGSSVKPSPKLTPSRPDLLTVSRSAHLASSPNSTRYPHMSPSRTRQLDRFEDFHEYGQISLNDNGDSTPYASSDYIVLADEALVDVCRKAQKLALSQQEHEAEFELECYSNDKQYYDMLEIRAIERQRDGAYSRFRTEGKNFAEKVQNKFVDAYAIMKEGKSETTTASVDHYKRKLEDPDVQNIMDNTKKTIYVNVIVKNSIQVVSNELDRLARQRWEERQKKEGSTDVRNEESRAQFEKFKAKAQGQLVQLAGLALASDFTPRRIAVQLSNDLYRLLTPRLKRRGVFIESEIEYRVGPYFVLAVNILSVDWTRLVKMTYKDVADRRAKWMKAAELDDSKDGITRRYGPIASLMRLSRMTRMEVLAGVLAILYHTHWIIYTPICWFLYRFLIGDLFREYFLSSVTDEIFYYVEQKGMEMDIQIENAETQAACMLSALQEIRTGNRALKKKEKAGTTEGEVELLGPLLGPAIKGDAKPAPPIPENFEVPENLDFVSLELNLQVGFQRIRWALLSSESSFIRDVVWKAELNYDNIEAKEWNKFNGEIGSPSLSDGVNEEEFIGAEKETSYLMPKSAFVAANTAHETAFVETYNDYCFSLKLRALTPDVPYGKTFEAWTKYVVINTGNNSCKLTCSVEAVFPNGPPMVSRQINSGMRDGVGKVFVKTGEALQKYATAYP